MTAGEAFVRMSHVHSDEAIRQLFVSARTILGSVPCQAHPNNGDHRYQINSRAPFRIRCQMPGCYHRLARSSIIEYISTLVEGGLLGVDELLQEAREGWDMAAARAEEGENQRLQAGYDAGEFAGHPWSAI